MHEASIALAIIGQVSERTAQKNIARVTAVQLKIGAMAGIDTNALLFAWDLATKSSPAEGSRLEIERIPLALHCEPCGGEQTVESGNIAVCPSCGTPSSNIVRGRELHISALEVIYDTNDGTRTSNPREERYAR